MLRSLVARIIVLGVLVSLALVAFSILLLGSSRQVSSSFVWVAHTQQVLRAATEPVDLVRRVESDLRGAAISRDRVNPRELKRLLDHASEKLDELVDLTQDNRQQNERAKALQIAVLKRSSFLSESLELVDVADRLDVRRTFTKSRLEEARRLMAQVDFKRDALVAAEQRLLMERTREATQRLSGNTRLLMVGVPAITILLAIALIIIIQAIRIPTRALITAMQALGPDNIALPLEKPLRQSREFSRIAVGYNAMIERLQDANALQHKNENAMQLLNVELQDRSRALEARNQVIERLGLMAHRMQAARTDEELADVVGRFLPQILPGLSGAVYAHNNSRNLLVQIASWGAALEVADRFSPEECWALRLGQSHELSDAHEDVVCKHVETSSPYHCEPLLAGGEVIGLLHIGCAIDPELQFRLKAVAEDISSALVNHRLQRSLREQTIRDPLTGLFNRRYLEESLRTEIARSTRSRAELTVVMVDVDHFKRFNDDHGHDAGDHVLKAVAAAMQSHFRGGDVVCRFGGEEFTVIAPGANAEVLIGRVEKLRVAINNLQVRFAGKSFDNLSASFGLATFDIGLDADGSTLIQAADEALYSAKRAGRNRTVIAQRGNENHQDYHLASE